MPVFPNGEWMGAFCAQVAARQVTDTLAGTSRLVIEPAGCLADRHVYEVRMVPSPNGGRCAADAPPLLDALRAVDTHWLGQAGRW